jgi:thymidylate synthase ThyX
MEMGDLKHVWRTLPSGGAVMVLDTGAVIGPESEAMLQALHSRSIGGVRAHLEKLAKSGAQNFMSQFYVGYGHKSIGDCGSITLFIEGVSMLAAKAVQDFMLYNGQEASTRYIDFASQPFLDPHNTANSKEISENWRRCYLKGLGLVQQALVAQNPRQSEEKEDIYQKAIKARSFDIMRWALPAGATTNLAWHGELRHIADHLDRLRHHPLEEVQQVALALEDALVEKFPSSFQKKRYEATEAYIDMWMQEEYYFDKLPATWPNRHAVAGDFSGMNREHLAEYEWLLRKRPKQTELPKFLAECGVAQFNYMLDFGSFRDNQRHRAVSQRMPVLTAHYGVSDWYLSQLPEAFLEEVMPFLTQQFGCIKHLSCSDTVRQYYVPMGCLVTCQMTGDLPAFVYLVERRARMDVHPTMRQIAQNIGELLLHQYADLGLELHMETSQDRFHYKRGEQDITERPSATA